MIKTPEEMLELAEKAENGPWILGGCSGRMITRLDGYCGNGFLADVDTKNNAEFIASSREFVPYAAKRLIEAEKLIEEAAEMLENIHGKDIPFTEKLREFLEDKK